MTAGFETELVGKALPCPELVGTALAYTEVLAVLLEMEVKMTFTLMVTLLVGDVATRSKYMVPTSFSSVEKTCS
jgi:hypothetical protein